MPPPLDPAKREQIAQAIRDGGTRNAIARDHDVSPSTVTMIAKQERIDGAFDRSATAPAREAAIADAKNRRANLRVALANDMARLREQLWEPARIHNFNKDGEHTSVLLDEPTFGDKRALTQSIKALGDTMLALEKADSGGGVEEAAGLIRDLVESIRGG